MLEKIIFQKRELILKFCFNLLGWESIKKGDGAGRCEDIINIIYVNSSDLSCYCYAIFEQQIVAMQCVNISNYTLIESELYIFWIKLNQHCL